MNYPHAPGFKALDTSRDAAQAITPRANTVRAQCLNTFRIGGGYTADEVARILGYSILTVRPRITELYKQGFIEPTGSRRTNKSGHAARVWVLRHAQGKLF